MISPKLVAVVVASLMASAAIAEDMSLPGPGSDCLSRASAQLSIYNAGCVGRHPVSTQLYASCISSAQQAYVGAVRWCVFVSGGKAGALRGGEPVKRNTLLSKGG